MSAKILLVEDERAQRLLYTQELEDEGYEVYAAKNGLEALEYQVDKQPDLAILDIALTGEDGLELMAKMLSVDEDLPIILHTAYPEWQQNWRGKLADAYVVKSSDLSHLKGLIQQLLGQRYQRRDA